MQLTKRNRGFNWFWWLLLGIGIIALNSCGAKKKHSVNRKINIEQRNDLYTKQQNDVRHIIKKMMESTEISFVPMNPEHPMIVGRDTFVNTRIDLKRKKLDSTATITDNSILEVEDKGTATTNVKEREVKTEREGFSREGLKTALIWIFIILVFGGVIYLRATGKKIFGR